MNKYRHGPHLIYEFIAALAGMCLLSKGKDIKTYINCGKYTTFFHSDMRGHYTVATKGELKRSNINSIHKIYIPTVIVCKQFVIVQKKPSQLLVIVTLFSQITIWQWHPVRYTVEPSVPVMSHLVAVMQWGLIT